MKLKKLKDIVMRRGQPCPEAGSDAWLEALPESYAKSEFLYAHWATQQRKKKFPIYFFR